MTANPSESNRVYLTGENSFIRLSQEEGGPQTTRVSHWRILLSPAGQGHVLYLKDDDGVRVYSDNIGLARWLQEAIESYLFPEFADQDIPVIEAEFDKAGDGRAFWTEYVESEDDIISLTWYDFLEPFMLVAPPGTTPGRPLGVYSCFTPARRAQITINGAVSPGRVTLEARGDRESSSACLAWSETWVGP